MCQVSCGDANANLVKVFQIPKEFAYTKGRLHGEFRKFRCDYRAKFSPGALFRIGGGGEFAGGRSKCFFL